MVTIYSWCSCICVCTFCYYQLQILPVRVPHWPCLTSYLMLCHWQDSSFPWEVYLVYLTMHWLCGMKEEVLRTSACECCSVGLKSLQSRRGRCSMASWGSLDWTCTTWPLKLHGNIVLMCCSEHVIVPTHTWFCCECGAVLSGSAHNCWWIYGFVVRWAWASMAYMCSDCACMPDEWVLMGLKHAKMMVNLWWMEWVWKGGWV